MKVAQPGSTMTWAPDLVPRDGDAEPRVAWAPAAAPTSTITSAACTAWTTDLRSASRLRERSKRWKIDDHEVAHALDPAVAEHALAGAHEVHLAEVERLVSRITEQGGWRPRTRRWPLQPR